MGSIRVIGITSIWDDMEKPFYKSTDPNNYNYGYNGYSGCKVTRNEFEKYGETWGKGVIGKDIIGIKLDLRKEGILTFYKNDQSQGVAFKVTVGEHIQYKLAISFY